MTEDTNAAQPLTRTKKRDTQPAREHSLPPTYEKCKNVLLFPRAVASWWTSGVIASDMNNCRFERMKKDPAAHMNIGTKTSSPELFDAVLKIFVC